MRTISSPLLSALGLVLLLAGCQAPGLTGSMEEEELYNTLGLQGRPLFDELGEAPVALASRPFVRVGLRWDAPEGVALEGRIFSPEGQFGPWREIAPRWSEGGAHNGLLDAEGGRGLAFQLRLTDGRAPSFLVAEAIEELGEPVLKAPEPPEPPPEGLASLGQALGPASLVKTRADWGARAPACSSGGHTPTRITIHHTATPLPDSISPTQRMRQMQNYHIDTRGWCDIGYHFVVDWNGQLWQGRNETVIGAHVADNNSNNVGISFMGTYNSNSPSGAQLEHVRQLVAWLSERYGVVRDRARVKGHREYRGNAAGDCPGDRVYARIGDLLGGDSGGGGDPGGGGGDPGGGTGSGNLQGVIFQDVGLGTGDMSRRIPGAQVTVSGGGTATARAGDAYWSLSLPAGAYTVTASASGYRSASRTCSLSAGAEAWCSIGLLPESSGGGGDTGGGGGDMGSQPGGGDTGGGGGDMGSQPGGGDTGEGGDTGGGGHGGFDPNAPRGRVKGYVVELNEVFDDLEACDGPRIGGAQVSAETGEQTTADGAGYFEFEVLAGEHLLGAKAAGYADGAAECSVLEGGEVECCIHLIPGLGGEQPPEDDPSVVVISCATSPAGSQAVGLVGLLLAGAWLVVRRRRA